VKICLPKANGAPQSKVKVNVLICSDKGRSLDLLKGGMSLVEVGGAMSKVNEASIAQVLNSVHPEPSWFFLNGCHIRTISQGSIYNTKTLLSLKALLLTKTKQKIKEYLIQHKF
jgi:hypothetical protein